LFLFFHILDQLKSYNILSEYGNAYNKYFATQSLSKIYISWNKPEQAVFYGKKAMELAQKTKSVRIVWSSNEYLGRAYAKAENYPMAYQFLNKAYNMRDTIYNQERDEIINELEVSYEAERKETENTMLRQDQMIQQLTIDRQRTLLIIAIVITVVAAFVLLLLWKLLQKRNRDARKIKEQNELLAFQANKLKQTDASRSRFFANISHDLRTPLTLINGFFQALKNEDNLLTNKTERVQERAWQSMRQMTQLTEEINDLTLIDGNKIDLSYSRVAVDKLVSIQVKMLHTQAEHKNIRLNYTSEIDDGTYIHADGKQLEKIINNLLINALKFTNNGGEISTTVSADDEYLMIRVKDNGVGISPGDIQYVFDRFFQSSNQAHSNREGLGIGLSMVKELTELHGGHVRVESDPGEGSEFMVSLPYNYDKQITQPGEYYLLTETPSVDQKSESIQMSVANGADQPYILIVEDHEEILNYVMSEIAPGYHLLTAGDGQQAIDILSKRKVDLILTDLMMPVVDGFQLIEYVKEQEQLKNIPILVLSAKSTNSDKDRILQLGVNDFVAKPFDHQELNLRIENLLKNVGRADTYTSLAKEKGHLSDIEMNLIGKLDALIFKHIDNPDLGVQMIADLLNTSERNAGRIVKGLTNEPPKSYIRKLRIDYAENLLKTQKVKSIKEACKAVGLSNSNSFAIQFEKQKGYPPKDLISK
ncbi:MAG: ATP-binding protein, partial [Bacteroidota bacterium]